MCDATRWEGRREARVFGEGRCYIERKVRYVGWFGFVKERIERIYVPDHSEPIANLLNRENVSVALRFTFRELELALASKESEYEVNGYKMPDRMFVRKRSK